MCDMLYKYYINTVTREVEKGNPFATYELLDLNKLSENEKRNKVVLFLTGVKNE
ncbi:MAG: hypothetical protein WC783_02855 [Candidatus Paceibacterota bacterium]|jgi:hypothetical protein